MQRPITLAAVSDEAGLRVERTLLTLRERATSTLREAIINHQLEPGLRLKERELCERLGVSRTSVREALRHLESEGLVRTVPHKGPMVASLTLDDARQLYEVRAALEGLVGELFGQRAESSLISALKRCATDIRARARRRDQAETLAAIERFYDVLFEGAGNAVCGRVIRSLNTRIAAFRRLSLADPKRRREMIDDIEEIVGAAERRDAAALRGACTRHVESAFRAVERQLLAHQAKQPKTSRS